MDVARASAHESLDVHAIDRRASLEAPVGVDRRRTAKVAEIQRAPSPPLDVRGAHGSEAPARRGRHDPPPAARTLFLLAARQGRDDSAVGTIVVLSPHSDDGVLSLGASMARWARSGRHVELLTVFALDPASSAPTGGWDRRAGFLTEGAAANARREEDRVACGILGVTPRWLPFGSVDFDRHGDENDVWEAMRERSSGPRSCWFRARHSHIPTMRGSTG